MKDLDINISKTLEKNNYNQIKMYVDLGFDFNLSDINHDNPEKFGTITTRVFDLVIENNLEGIKKYKLGALNKVNDNGYSALQWAIILKRNHIVKYLLDRGCDIYNKTATDENIFTLASRFKNNDIFLYLLKNFNSKEVFYKNYSGFNSLHFACATKNKLLIPFLIELADPKTIIRLNKYGANSLHWLVHGDYITDEYKSSLVDVFINSLYRKNTNKIIISSLLNHKNKINFTPFDWLNKYDNKLCFLNLKSRI